MQETATSTKRDIPPKLTSSESILATLELQHPHNDTVVHQKDSSPSAPLGNDVVQQDEAVLEPLVSLEPVDSGDALAETVLPVVEDPVVRTLEPLAPVPSAMPLNEYRAKFWLGPDGAAEEVPWLRPNFDGLLRKCLTASLICWDWPVAHLMACASDKLMSAEDKQQNTTWLLDWAAEFAAGGQVPPEGPRAYWQRELEQSVAKASPLSEAPARWLAAALLILDPGADAQWPFDDMTVDSLLTLMDVGVGQKRLLEDWVRICRTGHSPSAVYALSDEAVVAPGSLEERLVESRRSLKESIDKFYSAAGGKAKQTHCRNAWDGFVQKAHPLLVELSGKQHSVSRVDLDRLKKYGTRIFDRAGVKYGDRQNMDRAVDAWLKLGFEVLDATLEVSDAQTEQEQHGTGPRFSPEVEVLLADETVVEGLDGWLLTLVRMHLANYTSISLTTELSDARVRVCPFVVEGWGGLPGGAGSLDVRRVEQPLVAASRWLFHRLEEPVEDATLWLAEHRATLLRDDAELSKSVRSMIERQREILDDRIHTLGARLRSVALDLAELADSEASIARDASKLVDQALENELQGVDVLWLEHCSFVLESRRESLVDRLMWQAEQEGYPRDSLMRMKEVKQYSSLLLARNLKQPEVVATRPRATLYRPKAENRWPHPVQTLRAFLEDSANSGSAQFILVERWLNCRQKLLKSELSTSDDRALREAFVEVVMQVEAAQRKTSVRYRTPRGPYATNYTAVNMNDIRLWLEGGNPTFLPQLSRFQTLVVTCVPVSVTDRNLDRRVQRQSSARDMSIILAPGLPADRRAEIATSHRARFVAPLALIDDLDVCRLLNLGGVAPEPLLAMMELVAERQPWERFCPYEVVEGQHVRMEMFVGREEEAAKLAHQATYSRIFSGRRLGKTALLRFLQASKRYNELPSGNRLYVLFCSIAGDAHEDAVAAKILRAVCAEFGLELPEAQDADAMKKVLREFVASRPTDSLLILLDEADTFFEEEIQSWKSAKQQSLSWWMSRHGEKSLDANGIPRVRFVLCGYLHTDQNRGVWENKGDVLRLAPLRPPAAVELIAKPLARIGIDVANEADSIAFRCGYQPAVIIRFGLGLLEHLNRTRSRQEAEHVQVNRQDIIDVFHSNPVQQAIQEACWLNFVGHAAGQLVFAALLMELKVRTPAAPIADVADALLKHVQDVEPSFNPNSVYEGSWADFVTQQLRELVDRSLLIQVGHRPVAYRLRFPHHLPVLIVPDPAQRVRDALSVLLAGGRSRAPEWLLNDALFSELQYAVSKEGRDLGYSGAVVLSQWPKPIIESQHGLPVRLELAAGDVMTVEQIPEDSSSALPSRVFVGGLALGREVLAGVDEEWEVARTGRLTQEQIRGWFERRRATQFTADGAWERIMERTAGIPVLIQELDVLVQALPDEAPTIGSSQFGKLMDELDLRIQGVWESLINGPNTTTLTERELDIIAIVAKATEIMPEAPGWVIEEGDLQTDGGPQPIGPQDWPSLQLLMLLGLLPRRASGSEVVRSQVLAELGPLHPQDPLISLLHLTQ
jgi:hypothetical protein